MSNKATHFGRYFEKKLRQTGEYVFDDDEDEIWHIQPCSEQEISQIEQVNRVKLPEKYREFLSVMGRNAGDLFRSELCAYPELLRLTGEANGLLADWESQFRLSPTDFVLWSHGGYMFSCFDTASGAADPPVYFCREGLKQENPKKEADSFTEWMEIQLRDRLRIKRS